MPKLILTLDGAVLREFPVDKERITIGRKPGNDVQLNDATVSGTHAAILKLQNVYVEDLASTNGTELNGKRVQKRMLQHGDVIRIGQHRFEFVDAGAQDFEKTVVLSPGQQPAAPAPEAAPAESAPRSARIRLMDGATAGQTLALSKPHTTIGRPGLQVAVIARRGSGFVLTPMGGSGGEAPTVNGEAVSAGSRMLCDGDVLEVAGTRMTFLSD